MIPKTPWLPTPWLSLLLWVLWLLLNSSIAWGHILLGGILAVVIPLLTHPFWDRQPDLHKPLKLAGYILKVLWDIVVANFHVAYLILSGRPLRQAFVKIPLCLTQEYPITILASTISLTPGTVSTEVAPDKTYILVHALDVADEAALIAEIKARYEAPLQEIFPC